MKKKIKKALPFIIGGIAGLIGGFVGASSVEKESIRLPILIFGFVVLLICFYLHIIIHEAGHLIFGLLSGYKFVSFRVGSLILYRTNGKVKVGKYKLAGTGGQCLMAPPDLVNGQIPYCLFNFGGAIMNLFFAFPAMFVLFFYDLSGMLKLCFILWMLVGLGCAAMNGIPMSVGSVDNDGKNALNLGKNPKALYSFWLQLKVNQLQMDGKVLLDMPKEWFERPTNEEMKNPMVAVIGALYCNRKMEEKSYEESSQVIHDILKNASGILPIHYMLLQIDRIFCEIMSGRDEKVLSDFQDKGLQNFVKAMKNYPSIIRTSYAYALCIEKDEEKAKKIKKHFEKIAKTHPNKAELQIERAFILDCENTKLS